MARTRRNLISGPAKDGQECWPTILARDDRATGLRDHGRDRREARADLRNGDEHKVAGGKRRRYSNSYGQYEY